MKLLKIRLEDVNKTREIYGIRAALKIDDINFYDIYMDLNQRVKNKEINLSEILSVRYDFSFKRLIVEYLEEEI